MASMISIGLRTKELLRHQCSYHGNLGTIATRCVANAYCLKEALC